MVTKEDKQRYIIWLLLFLLVLGILGVATGILVVTVNIKNDLNNPPTPAAHPTLSTSMATNTKTTSGTVPTTTEEPYSSQSPATNDVITDGTTPTQPGPPQSTTDEPTSSQAPITNGATTDGTVPTQTTSPDSTTPAPSNGNPLNVPQAQPIQPGSSNYDSYAEVVELFKQGLNTKVNPCDDFYAYTCGSFNGEMSFKFSDLDNARKMAEQMMNQTYVDAAPLPVKQVVAYFNQCRQARANWNELVKDGKMVTDAINALSAGLDGVSGTQFPFPMYDQTSTITTFPNSTGIGFLLGYPTGKFGVETLVSSYTDTNWKDPHGQQGYGLFIDQPSTMLPNTYYRKAWKQYQPIMLWNVIQTMNAYAQSQGKTLDQEKLRNDAMDIVALDYKLAMYFSTDDTTRRQFARNYNPMTIPQLNVKYPNIDWHIFFTESLLSASPKVSDKVLSSKSNFQMIVMESEMLQKINDALVLNNPYGIEPEALVNYIFYQVVNANSDYLPWSGQSEERTTMLNAASKRDGRNMVVPDKRKFERRQMDDVDEIAKSCAMETIEALQYANARVFIDNLYPTQQDRDGIQYNIGKVASSIVVGFRSMIDQLKWMTDSTKKGAYNKIDNLVKNIAYPDWLTDDNQLTQYHEPLGINLTDGYLTMVTKAGQFSLYTMWDYLVAGSSNRIDFSGPPGTTKAWYQPEMNSITFPAAILRQPFYDPQWPAAVNFGAMGVIAGHELTHGFDDQGVQWDGTGVLEGWMDEKSNTAFTNMAGCVVSEYSNFCPLNKTVYDAGACIDGEQTQGENIADNGVCLRNASFSGIHSAFRAYKNYVNLYGPDPQLPDPALQLFTSDQLFFLAFAQVWCQLPATDAQIASQILVDVHSPSKYRVWGTIQNFPAFKDAFHCPSPSAYAPDTHCDVWVSDVPMSIGEPVEETDLNIPVNPQIRPDDGDSYNEYRQAISFYQSSVNLSADPCNDFWSYACGSYDQKGSFETLDQDNIESIVKQLTDNSYQTTIQGSTALSKVKQFFNKCVATISNEQINNATLAAQNLLGAKAAALAAHLGMPFPIASGAPASALPNPEQLGAALGYLSFTEGIDTLVTPIVDNNWMDNSHGYYMFIDQNTAENGKAVYTPDAFVTIKDDYIASTVSVVRQYLTEQGAAIPVNLKNMVTDIILFEQIIAYNYSTDDTVRRQFERSWNPTSMEDLKKKYSFVDWTVFFAQAPESAKINITSPSFMPSVKETDMIARLSTDYQASVFDSTTVVNYLYTRLILDKAQYLPQYSSALGEMPESDSFSLGRQGGGKIPRRCLTAAAAAAADVTAEQLNCVNTANYLMEFAIGRVFIDFLYPDQAAKDNIRQTAGGLIENVINSFKGMLDSLDWMDAATRKKALDKTDGIIRNIAFPDWITDNGALDSYHSALTFADDDTYYTMLEKLNTWNIMGDYQYLTFPQADRHLFTTPVIVNAWYNLVINSISFPAGILRPPFFHPKWPASLNYGAMGTVAGHELTHAFDDEGVQWDGTGNLKRWMDANSTVGFKNMAQCVIDEYSQFCPLDSNTYSPNCVNGVQTQGENIADNGGIHSAFRAYRTHVALNGPDPQLPDRLLGQFTHDQLFFLNFGQVYCEKGRGDEPIYRQMLMDTHSPSKYRVLGTLQNYPAFRAAFNCPADSVYSPNNHCKVWVRNNET